ncbi:DUF4362 domain-containing protein [Sporosarcina gallistercoris]|uniref:DUF4362 domain-containing protein n=1 Tax=Sporosarcina gallistercoris TaxID=2762245 RepID=A0ABR8PJB8_9BACL|nr:DUF4362 domain-containing protein [Sporosarcina gallistercoris]MBD7908253.1 DUF4362 domain-containing protein [Sporosarcina gallistercoris]
MLLRVVNYTDEGDLVIHDLNYSNYKITSTIDRRADELKKRRLCNVQSGHDLELLWSWVLHRRLVLKESLQ